MGIWGRNTEPENKPGLNTQPRAIVRSVRVTDDRGNHYDVAGEDLTWAFDGDKKFVHVFGSGASLASIGYPIRVIALDWGTE